MDKCKDITYCFGRPNTVYEARCKNCERYIRLYDFRGQIFSLSNFDVIGKKGKCEYFMERE